MAIAYTEDHVRHGYLVLATADTQINLTGMGASPIPAGRELCLFWIQDSTAGAKAQRGALAGTMLITAYYLQDQASNEQLIRQNCTPSVAKYPPVRFRSKTREVFDVDAMLNWHNTARTSLVHYAATAAGIDPLGAARFTPGEMFKGTRWAGKQQTPEAYLAMAFRRGIPAGRDVHSNQQREWSARAVYRYALKAGRAP